MNDSKTEAPKKSDGWLVCDGLCITAADVGVGSADQVAYPHPGCPVHAPDEVCQCGNPDRCLSPTHGQIGLGEALQIASRQRRDVEWTAR